MRLFIVMTILFVIAASASKAVRGDRQIARVIEMGNAFPAATAPSYPVTLVRGAR